MQPGTATTPKTYLVPPDGGWGWLILASAMLVNIIISGIIKSFGILVVEIEEVFELDEFEILWIPAITYFFYSFLGPASSIIAIQYSFRFVTLIGGAFIALGMMLIYFVQSLPALYLTYGVLVGVGAGLAFPATVYIVNSYFWKLRGLANGLCISGSALGAIIMPPFISFLITHYTFRGASLILGALTLNIWVSALIYEDVDLHSVEMVLDKAPCDLDIRVVEPKPKRPLDEEPCDDSAEKHAKNYYPTRHHGVTLTQHKPQQFDKDIRRMSVAEDKLAILKKYLDFGLLVDPVYLVILVSNAASSVSYTNFVIFLPMYGVQRGIAHGDAPYLISILSLFDLIGRLGASILSDFRLMPKSFYFVGGLVFSGLSLLCVPFMADFVSISALSACFGISSGAVIGVTAIVMSDYLGREKLTSTYGISLFANGILQLIGPPVCALILGEAPHNFLVLFLVLGFVTIVGTSFWALMPYIQSRKAKREQENQSQRTAPIVE